jgi:predicted permease
VSLVLLAATGLLLRGLSEAWTTDVGFSYRDRVAVSMDLRLQQYTRPRASAFYATLLERVRALPGVDSATAAHLIPFGGRVFAHEVSMPGRSPDPDGAPERAAVNRVWPDFFSTLQIPIVQGRALTAEDIKPVPDAAVVSETMARRYWPAASALGERFSVDGPGGPFVTVVGVARDVAIDEFSERPWPAAYLPHDLGPAEFAVIARSQRPAAQIIREIEAIARGLDPDLPLYASRPLSAWVAERMDGERALSQMLGICGGLALFLASMGLYGVMAYAVARRTREMGIRMALGADRAAVRSQFVREALRLGVTGIACGIAPAVGLNVLIRGMVVGVSPADPATLGGAALLLISATLLAAYVPARRATRIEPLEALRAE